MKKRQEAVKTFSSYVRYNTASLYSKPDGDKEPVTRAEFYNMMNHLDYVLTTLVPKPRVLHKKKRKPLKPNQ